MTMREENDASLSLPSSIESLSSSEFADDASSTAPSSCCPTSVISNGPLFELSELMAQLPIKKGLSRCYEGKSQSFKSLSRVTSIEDLVKKKTPLKRRNKTCMKNGGGKDRQKSYTLPKATIFKGTSKISVFSLGGKGSFS